MSKKKNNTENVITDYGTYNIRNLAQLIRRNMMSREYKDKTKYTRKLKHKNRHGTSN